MLKELLMRKRRTLTSDLGDAGRDGTFAGEKISSNSSSSFSYSPLMPPPSSSSNYDQHRSLSWRSLIALFEGRKRGINREGYVRIANDLEHSTPMLNEQSNGETESAVPGPATSDDAVPDNGRTYGAVGSPARRIKRFDPGYDPEQDRRRTFCVSTNIDLEEGGVDKKSKCKKLLEFVTPWRLVVASLLVLLLLGALIAFFLVLFVGGLGQKSTSNSNASSQTSSFILPQTNDSDESERFMRLFEELWAVAPTPKYQLTDAVVERLSNDKLVRAEAAGILPINDGSPTSTSPNEKDHQKQQHQHKSSQQKSSSPKPPPNSHKCNIQCNKADITVPPLVVISVDGFARDYLERGLVPQLDILAECGARAERVFPVYPSKTFPSHYSIATGLYPESHGVVDNYVYDPNVSSQLQDMKLTKVPGLYHGEPIWSFAVRNRLRMHCLFWPGCSMNATSHNPTLDVPYDESLSFSRRAEMIVEWLLLPAAKRPHMIMAYFDQPDNAGHFHTNDKQVNLELRYVDSILHYLLKMLETNALLDCVNLLIVSDHGMRVLDTRYYFDALLPETQKMVIAPGVMGRLYFNGSPNKSLDWVFENVKSFDNTKYRLYDRRHMPKRYHHSKTALVGDVVFEGQPGTTFYTTISEEYGITSDHGFDYLDESMHAIFFARGPNIKPGVQLAPFQHIEYFNLFVDLLRLPPFEVPNNGTRGVLKGVLNNIDEVHPPSSPFLMIPSNNDGPVTGVGDAALPMVVRPVRDCRRMPSPAGVSSGHPSASKHQPKTPSLPSLIACPSQQSSNDTTNNNGGCEAEVQELNRVLGECIEGGAGEGAVGHLPQRNIFIAIESPGLELCAHDLCTLTVISSPPIQGPMRMNADGTSGTNDGEGGDGGMMAMMAGGGTTTTVPITVVNELIERKKSDDKEIPIVSTATAGQCLISAVDGEHHQHDQMGSDGCKSWPHGVAEPVISGNDGVIDAGFTWHSLLADLNSAIHGLDKVQFLTFRGFVNNDGAFAELQQQTEVYAQQFGRLISITGTLFDDDMDGLADTIDFRTKILHKRSKNNDSGIVIQQKLPTHVFRLLIRCDDGLWHVDGTHCRHLEATRILTFILPNLPRDPNKLHPKEYLRVHMARVRDVELLTGLHFFGDRTVFSEELALQWRVNITTSLW